MTMLSPSHHSVSFYFSLVNIFIETTSGFFFFSLAAIEKNLGKEQQNTLIIFPNLCWKHFFTVLPMKSLPAMWLLSITLTNRTQTKQPTALCAQMHLLPFTYTWKVGMAYLFLQSAFTTASPSLTGNSEGHYRTNIDLPHSFSITWKSLTECWCFCASETPKLGTPFCRSCMCVVIMLSGQGLFWRHMQLKVGSRKEVFSLVLWLALLLFPHWITTPVNPPVQEVVFCVLNAAITYKALLLNVPKVTPAGQFQSNCVQFIPAE